jgi:hypothetical protein
MENGVSHAPIQLINDDFLRNEDVKNAVSTAGVVFMNNPKFGAALNFQVLSQCEESNCYNFFIFTIDQLRFVH